MGGVEEGAKAGVNLCREVDEHFEVVSPLRGFWW